MGSNLPKIKRVTKGERRTVQLLLIVAATLLVSIVFILMSGVFDPQPSSIEERNVMLLERGLAQDPNNAEIRMQLAEAQYDTGRRAEAMENARLAAEAAPDAPLMNLRYAQLLLREERFEEAETHAVAEIDLLGITTEASAHALLAQIYRAQGRIDEALVEMAIAVRVADTAADLRILYAEMLAEAGQNDAAIEQYQEALRFLPNDARAIKGLEVLGVTWEETETVDPHSGTPPAQTP